jgi:cytochrome oxidase Cu insertion factor (SCO1/SenC/PrrC family)
MTEPVSTDSATTAGQRRKMLLVVLVAALPALIATVLVLTDWRPSGRSLARGELLQPVRPLPKPDWQAFGEASRESRIGEGKWLLLTLADARCDEACERTLFSMQQARLLTHKDMRRVERVLLAHAMPASELKTLQEKFPGMDVYRAAPDPAFRKLLLEDGRDPQAWIFLIDPLGNLVLRYAPGADTAGLHKDLLRLLKLSRIG